MPNERRRGRKKGESMGCCQACQTGDTKAKDLDALLARVAAMPNPGRQLIEVLHQVQELYGYLAPEALAKVSGALGVSMARIYGVATFYHYFNIEPRGKYVVSICQGTACYVKGAPRVLDAIMQELGIKIGETSADMVFTLLETRCLGACGLAPTMMINNRIFGELSPKKAVEILRRFRSGKMRDGV